MQLIEVTGENAHARCVPKTILNGRVVQPAEDLQLLQVIGQFGEQGRRVFECAIRLRDQFGLIKAEMVYDREQPSWRFRAGHLPEALQPRQ